MAEVVPAASPLSWLDLPHAGTSEPEIDTSAPPAPSLASVSRDELVSLCALDTELFAQSFFPKTFRQESPAFAPDLWRALENPLDRFVNAVCFRGSSKTTRLRVFCAKRIAYRISRTVLFVSASEPKASQSIQWLRGQVERNRFFADTFGLEQGRKWHETEIEIRSRVDGTTSWIIGAGITSNLRGINFDDYRPDLIVLDDVLTDENVLTEEQRKKLLELIIGAIANSLAPASEEPNSKMAMCQTPLHVRDAAAVAESSSAWRTVKFGCWTNETAELPDDQKISSWPARYPTTDLLRSKHAHADMGTLSIWLREMECKLVSSETASFRPHMLQYYGDDAPGAASIPEPTGFVTSILSIDPVPPPTDVAVEKDLHRRDFEAVVVQSRLNGNYFLREYALSRGHNPDWTIATAFALAALYNVQFIAVETIAYQAALKWLLEKEMLRRQQFYAILPVGQKERRVPKYTRIVTAFIGVVSQRRYYIRRSHYEFLDAFTQYPRVDHDDLLDAAAIGLRALVNPALEQTGPAQNDDDARFPDSELPQMRWAP